MNEIKSITNSYELLACTDYVPIELAIVIKNNSKFLTIRKNEKHHIFKLAKDGRVSIKQLIEKINLIR